MLEWDTEEYRAGRRAAYEAIRYRHPDIVTVRFDCNAGWFPILGRFFDEVAEVIATAPRATFDLWQVKEKMGGLSIYCVLDSHRRDDDVRRRINGAYEAARREANVTCDVCGEPGVLRVTEGCFMTRCEQHADGGVPYQPKEGNE